MNNKKNKNSTEHFANYMNRQIIGKDEKVLSFIHKIKISKFNKIKISMTFHFSTII